MIKEIIGNYSDSQEFQLGDKMSLLLFKGSCVLMDNAGTCKEIFVMTLEQATKMKAALEGAL